jgi:hypothetical protein
VAPAGGHWRPGAARARVRALRREDRRGYSVRLAEFAVLYLAAQGVGGLVAWFRPYIWDNPAFGSDPDAERWVFSYPDFALQAVCIYVLVCLATAWYAGRLRQLAVATDTDRRPDHGPDRQPGRSPDPSPHGGA